MAAPSRREFLAATAAASFAYAAPAASPKLTVSTFTEEVTPPIGHPCMGGGIAPVKEVIDPLFAHGFVLYGAADPIAVVAVDWCEIRNDAYDRWRDAVAEAVGTKRERVLVTALHQHDAPVADLTAQKRLDDAKCQGAICDAEFHEKTVRRVAKAAKAAMGKAQRLSHVGTGQAKVENVASNRRYVDESGRIRFDRTSATRDPKARAADGGLVDPYLKTLSLWDEGRPVLAVSAYAVHPMSFYGKGGVSADFVGLARKLRQAEEPKTHQVYVSGCSGNVTAGKYNDGSPDNRLALAKRVHEAMREAWKNTTRQPIDECSFRATPLRLPVRSGKGFTEEELTKRLKEDPKPFGQCLAGLGLSWRKRATAGEPIDACAIDFGGPALMLLPAESYVEYQLMAQAARPKGFVVTAGYGECGPGYIPTEKAWAENDSNLTDWCWVDPGCEELMKQAIAEVLK
ncbi:MAG TPA: hypothetical protein VKE40_21965 [Gemmataceae bacterium]|nr:hypothetical protein [Gemmataceae bacterium]